MENDQEKRKRLVWEIDRRCAGGPGEADRLSPAVRHLLATAVKGLRMMVNSVFNG